MLVRRHSTHDPSSAKAIPCSPHRPLTKLLLARASSGAIPRARRRSPPAVSMKDCIRLRIHLGPAVTDPAFVRVARGDRHVSHVAMLRRDADVRAMAPYLAEAHEFSLRD